MKVWKMVKNTLAFFGTGRWGFRVMPA